MTDAICKGDHVRYKRWVGEVYEVLSDGGVYIDFTRCPDPIPFFRGPYRLDEIEKVRKDLAP